MTLTISLRRRLRSMFWMITGWMIAVYLTIWIIADTPLSIIHLKEGMIAGVLAGLGSYLFESSRLFNRKTIALSAWQILTVRSLWYSGLICVITFIMAFLRTRFMTGSLRLDFIFEPKFHEFLLGGRFALVFVLMFSASVVINFIRQINRMLGPGTLLKLFLGTYVRPVHEERVFMFLDLNDSTAIAERLGPLGFTEFKNDFFYDLAEPVLETQGEVFQYVGDEAVITWRLGKGVENANWLRCYQLLQAKIAIAAERYRSAYGVVPKFKAGFHSGSAVTAEIGDIKRDIVYSGDTVNTAARIEGQCRSLGRSLLVSDDLRRNTPLSENIEFEDMGLIALKGKEQPLRLWSVKNGNGRAVYDIAQ